MYVRRYARTIHGALTKSFKSCETVTSDVDTIEVSRLEKSSPVSKLDAVSTKPVTLGQWVRTIIRAPPAVVR